MNVKALVTTAFLLLVGVAPSTSAPAAGAESPRPRVFAGRVVSVDKKGSFILQTASRKTPRVTVTFDKKVVWKGLPRTGNRVQIGDPVMVTGVLGANAALKAAQITVQDPNERPAASGGPAKTP